MAKHVETACRDCKKCTNSVAANVGRNTGRATMAVMTFGMSEAGLAARKKCRLCGHQLSLHEGAESPTVQPTVVVNAPVSPPPSPQFLSQMATDSQLSQLPVAGPDTEPGASQPMTCKGVNGTVTFDGTWVTISRTGFLARSTVGKGEKRISVSQITSVRWKPPTKLIRGYISFALPGGNETDRALGRRLSTPPGMRTPLWSLSQVSRSSRLFVTQLSPPSQRDIRLLWHPLSRLRPRATQPTSSGSWLTFTRAASSLMRSSPPSGRHSWNSSKEVPTTLAMI